MQEILSAFDSNWWYVLALFVVTWIISSVFAWIFFGKNQGKVGLVVSLVATAMIRFRAHFNFGAQEVAENEQVPKDKAVDWLSATWDKISDKLSWEILWIIPIWFVLSYVLGRFKVARPKRSAAMIVVIICTLLYLKDSRETIFMLWHFALLGFVASFLTISIYRFAKSLGLASVSGLLILGWGHMLYRELGLPGFGAEKEIGKILVIQVVVQSLLTSGILGYMIWRWRQAIVDGQWYVAISHVTKKPMSYPDFKTKNVVVSFVMVVVSMIAIVWHPKLLTSFLKIPVLPLLSGLALFWHYKKVQWFYSDEDGADAPGMFYSAATPKSLLIQISIFIAVFLLAYLTKSSLFRVPVPGIVFWPVAIHELYKLATIIIVPLGMQMVPYGADNVRKHPFFFGYRKEQRKKEPGDFPVEKGSPLKAFRGGFHTWSIAAWMPKEYARLLILPHEEWELNTQKFDPVAVGELAWPKSNALDTDGGDELNQAMNEALDGLNEEAITEVIYTLGITFWTYVDPERWVVLSDEDRADPYRYVMERIHAALSTFTSRMTLHQALIVKLLRNPKVKFQIDGDMMTFKEYLTMIFREDLGWEIKRITWKDTDQTDKVKELQEQIKMATGRLELANREVLIAEAKAKADGAKLTGVLRVIAAQIEGQDPDEESYNPSPEALQLARDYVIAQQATDPTSSNRTLYNLPPGVANVLGRMGGE